jgi:hypothetical protein
MKKIYGIGLPRTGTASLALTLSNIGIDTMHYCVLHDNEEKNDDTNIVSIVDNSFYSSYQELVKESKNSLFILTTRDKNDWQRSIRRFKNIPKNIPDIEEYQNEIQEFFNSKEHCGRLLIINIFEDKNCMEKIMKFINIECNNIKFSHVKREFLQ